MFIHLKSDIPGTLTARQLQVVLAALQDSFINVGEPQGGPINTARKLYGRSNDPEETSSASKLERVPPSDKI